MTWFTSAYNDFFKDLAKHNDREWFAVNKKRYENDVKKPFEGFITDMILRMQAIDPNCKIEAKDAIFRIYRDTRFSKDKTPYKTQMSAVVSQGGRKDTTLEGIYLELGFEHIRMYGGVYQPNKDQLYSIRQEILYNLTDFEKLINEQKFKARFGEIRGEKNKRLPPEFVEIQDKQPLIANKQFYYFTEFDPKLLTSDGLIDAFFEAYGESRDVRNFLHAPLSD
ncbi:MAG: DUF2461 domain-containing protein [Flavobacteriales bacterium]|nr:DUF2461 domain-containing protein [Flavobacteriales bacterium]